MVSWRLGSGKSGEKTTHLFVQILNDSGNFWNTLESNRFYSHFPNYHDKTSRAPGSHRRHLWPHFPKFAIKKSRAGIALARRAARRCTRCLLKVGSDRPRRKRHRRLSRAHTNTAVCSDSISVRNFKRSSNRYYSRRRHVLNLASCVRPAKRRLLSAVPLLMSPPSYVTA